MSTGNSIDNPYVEFAALLDRRGERRTRGTLAGNGLALGVIGDDLGLTIDGMRDVIHEYLVSHHLCLTLPDMTETETDGAGMTSLVSGHTHDRLAHVHQVKTPAPIHPLRAGDRVLVAILLDGGQVVILSRLVPSSAIPR